MVATAQTAGSTQQTKNPVLNGAAKGKPGAEAKLKTEPEAFSTPEKFFIGKTVKIVAPKEHLIALSMEDRKPDEPGEIEGTLLSVTLDDHGGVVSGVLRYREGRKFWNTALLPLSGCALSYVEKVETAESEDAKDN